MASVFRHILRNIRRNGNKRAALGGSPAVGTHRAGMHQASEHEYQRSRMANDAPEQETPEEALEMPAEIEAEIPPVEEEDDEEVAAVAGGSAAVEADEEILDDVAAPDGSITEEETLSRKRMAADYSGERIPEMMPPVSDPVPADTPLMYSPGDGSLKEIQEPLPGMGDKYGIPPVINGMIDPSANVPEKPEDPEPDPEPEPEPDPETPGEG